MRIVDMCFCVIFAYYWEYLKFVFLLVLSSFFVILYKFALNICLKMHIGCMVHRICKKYATICKKICNNMQKYATICKHIQQYAKNMQQYAKICNNMQIAVLQMLARLSLHLLMIWTSLLHSFGSVKCQEPSYHILRCQNAMPAPLHDT